MDQQAQVKAPIKVGDKIRILQDGLTSAAVYEGDILKVEDVVFYDEFPGGGYIKTDGGWHFNFSDSINGFEIVSDSPITLNLPEIKIQTEEISLDGHYDFFYELTPWEAQFLQVKLDPYKVSSVWKLGEKDNTGCIFHILKTIARFGEKNDKEREIKAMYATIKRLAEIEGVGLGE